MDASKDFVKNVLNMYFLMFYVLQLVGGVFYWVQVMTTIPRNFFDLPLHNRFQTNAVSQNMIQRYLSLSSLKAGKRAVWIFVFGVIVLMMLCS